MKKIIFYTLIHCNNYRLNIDCREITEECPVKWWDRNLWTTKEYNMNEYRCKINYIAYEDSV